MKILVLGANGLIGSTMMQVLATRTDWQVHGTVRARSNPLHNTPADRVITGIEFGNPDTLPHLLLASRPDVVVNCAGLTKHLPGGNDPIPALSLNALLPHRLAQACLLTGARLIHISSDCVFSGKQGGYLETDHPDATDIYGQSKHLGEVTGEGAVTLRTSTIGHELDTRYGLLEWFLAQTECKGFSKAIFSGLPTVVLAEVVRDVVIPATGLTGLYHVGAQPIDKYSLLQLIAKTYQQDVVIHRDDTFVIDRSLNVEKFHHATGYVAPPWPELIDVMHSHRSKQN